MLCHPVRKKIVRRPLDHSRMSGLRELPGLLQGIYASRQVNSVHELERSLKHLPSPSLLSGMDDAMEILSRAIAQQRRLMVIGDYDADGATASALAIRGLKSLGLEQVLYLVPNRFEYGYGLTPEIVELAAGQRPDILLTVDNGISSIEGVAAARALGMEVLVTDHHLPGPVLPDANGIVNPNLPDDRFPGKSLAGVGVMFYVLMALRQHLRETGHFEQTHRPEPNLGQLLDLVALGTIADVVHLDQINRIFVHQGLQRIRSGQALPGIIALLEAAGRNPSQASAMDLGFFAGPRLNAAGRLDDMTVGIECLLSSDVGSARELAGQLNVLNQERRKIEDQMKQEALCALERLGKLDESAMAFCLFEEGWHQGVVGIVASRIKDIVNRPVIAFAPADTADQQLRGSARSIPGIHIRDVLANVATRHPGLIAKFGGHAMAAGLSLNRDKFDQFSEAFTTEVERQAASVNLEHSVHSDGPLPAEALTLATAGQLQQGGPWGQGFPEPLFDGEFKVNRAWIVGTNHLRLKLQPIGSAEIVDAIAFGLDEPHRWQTIQQVKAAYRLDINEYRNNQTLQLRIEYMEDMDG